MVILQLMLYNAIHIYEIKTAFFLKKYVINKEHLLNNFPKDSLFDFSASYNRFPSLTKAPAH